MFINSYLTDNNYLSERLVINLLEFLRAAIFARFFLSNFISSFPKPFLLSRITAYNIMLISLIKIYIR